ncbi:hypothetical protein FSPOR_11754 [Fusarium sporotrichioides]|uniref:RING-type domain-containing protein n=1 Tax=Fusarium sporotrichioides TaxID=5514 RepID=A0A395RFH6_FUSSP|nr:hypothetical protein FSPOR_11754 [Fusarium sporotrichioides]
MSATPTFKDMCTETHWSVLSSYLKNDKVSFKDLELPCGICRNTMTVLSHQHHKDEDGNTHNAVVFPCGHIFGKSCVDLAFGKESSLQPVCFACRADLTHSECGHLHSGLPMPSSKEDLGSIPAVLSKQGRMAPYCAGCIYGDLLDDLWQYVEEFILPTEGQRLMGFCHLVSDPDAEVPCWTPFQPDGRGLEDDPDKYRCEPPEEATQALIHFEERLENAEFGQYWFKNNLPRFEWKFFMWKPSMPKPAFHEYVDYKFFMESETAKSMTMDELRAEFNGGQ